MTEGEGKRAKKGKKGGADGDLQVNSETDTSETCSNARRGQKGCKIERLGRREARRPLRVQMQGAPRIEIGDYGATTNWANRSALACIARQPSLTGRCIRTEALDNAICCKTTRRLPLQLSSFQRADGKAALKVRSRAERRDGTSETSTGRQTGRRAFVPFVTSHALWAQRAIIPWPPLPLSHHPRFILHPSSCLFPFLLFHRVLASLASRRAPGSRLHFVRNLQLILTC